MSNLYPPYIEGKLPAFYDITKVAIPFEMNKTVGWDDFDGLKLIIKDVYDNSHIKTFSATKGNIQNNVAYFNCSEEMKLETGQYYKAQLAYYKSNTTGYYSTVGVIKYTNYPAAIINEDIYAYLQNTIKDLEQADIDYRNGKYKTEEEYLQKREEINHYYIEETNKIIQSAINLNKNIYQGRYINKDSKEKVYSYRFDLYDSLDCKNLLYTSDWLLHNNESDEDGVNYSIDSFELNYYLEEDKTYYLKYGVKTINDLEVWSSAYAVCNSKTVDPEIKGEFTATLNRENAYVDLEIAAPANETITGHFRIMRASSENNFATWEIIAAAYFNNESPNAHTWRDYAVRHGDIYRYAIQQYNSYGFYSNKLLAAEDVEVVFEDAFLFDGKRQLKIKYNPKISSFKSNLLEQKTNTIGAKFPIISRNGHVSYKEFPISGLISYLSDEENLFMSDEELGLHTLDLVRQETSADSSWLADCEIAIIDSEGHELTIYNDQGKEQTHNYQIENARQRTTNLTDYNVTAERKFKMAALDFLTNGKPKLFKSPEEGNYIVYLMNTSLAPNDTVGRMLHTFSTTATEIEDYSYEGLRKQNILQKIEISTNISNSGEDFDNYKSVKYYDVIEDEFTNEGWIINDKILSERQLSKVYSLTITKNNNDDGYIRINNQKITPLKKVTIINNPGDIRKLYISSGIELKITYQYVEFDIVEVKNNESTE